jgi:glycosyltransferase involved in cell wall biosynthesis
MKKTLAIVSPAYNEAEGIETFYNAVKAEVSKLSSYSTDIIIVIDGGVDDTFSILKNIAARDAHLRVIKLSRNFSPQMATLAGIDHADADAIITMDSDLQHPPEIIPLLIKGYEEGDEIVYTIRKSTENLALIRRMASVIFYRLVNLISDIPIDENACDFRLISRKVAKVIREDIRERNMFLRGIINWVGFKRSSISFTANARVAGKSKISLARLLQLAIFGMISFSKKPLRAAAVVGMLCALFGFVFALFAIVQYFLGQANSPGFSTIVVLLSVFGGLQLMFLGIIGEYIGAIFDEVKGRPHYIVDETVNISA